MCEHEDVKVAVFASPFKGGDVCLRYCPRCCRYELRYTAQWRAPFGGVCSGSALCGCDAGDANQVAALMLDAIDIAHTPLLERD